MFLIHFVEKLDDIGEVHTSGQDDISIFGTNAKAIIKWKLQEVLT